MSTSWARVERRSFFWFALILCFYSCQCHDDSIAKWQMLTKMCFWFCCWSYLNLSFSANKSSLKKFFALLPQQKNEEIWAKLSNDDICNVKNQENNTVQSDTLSVSLSKILIELMNVYFWLIGIICYNALL